MCDDQRPTLTLTYPRPGNNESLSRIVVGMHDTGSGLNMDSFVAGADFDIDGIGAGENLASSFKEVSQGVWAFKLAKPVTQLQSGKFTVWVKDQQGNITRIDRVISVGKR